MLFLSLCFFLCWKPTKLTFGSFSFAHDTVKNVYTKWISFICCIAFYWIGWSLSVPLWIDKILFETYEYHIQNCLWHSSTQSTKLNGLFQTNRCYSRFKLLIFCCCVFGHFFCLIRYSYCCFIVVSIKIIGINLHHRHAHTLCHLSISLSLSFFLVLVVCKSNVILTLKCGKNQFKGKLYSLMTSYYQLHATDKKYDASFHRIALFK